MFKFYIKNHWFFSVLGALLLFVLSLMPAGPVNPLSWITLLHIDKAAHILAYAMWSLALFISFFYQFNKSISLLKHPILPFLIVIIYGVFMEYLQLIISKDRVGEWPDILANTIGCLVGFSLFLWIKKAEILHPKS